MEGNMVESESSITAESIERYQNFQDCELVRDVRTGENNTEVPSSSEESPQSLMRISPARVLLPVEHKNKINLKLAEQHRPHQISRRNQRMHSESPRTLLTDRLPIFKDSNVSKKSSTANVLPARSSVYLDASGKWQYKYSKFSEVSSVVRWASFKRDLPSKRESSFDYSIKAPIHIESRNKWQELLEIFESKKR